MRKFIIVALILSLFTVVLSGCYDAVSVDSYSYVIGIGVDKGDSSKIKLSLQFAVSSEESDSSGGSSQSKKSKVITVDCDTIEVGINIINNYLSNKANLAHCSVVVFSEELCSSGINEYVTTLVNNSEFRPTCNVIVSKCTAEEFLTTSGNSTEEFSARYYESILNSSDYTGFSIESAFSVFYSQFNSDVASTYAILSDVIDDTPQNIGIAVFNGDKVVRRTKFS